jgi:hypothetical protein
MKLAKAPQAWGASVLLTCHPHNASDNKNRNQGDGGYGICDTVTTLFEFYRFIHYFYAPSGR